MKYLLIIFLLLSPSVVWSEDISIDDLVQRDGLMYEKFKDVPFTGEVTGFQIGKVRDGLRIGKWLAFYPNGQLRYKHNYKDGKYDGERVEYYENGQLKDKINYKEGALEGERIEYFEKVNMYCFASFFVDGIQNSNDDIIIY